MRFGWSASSVPVAPLLLAGMAVGPHGINLLPPTSLTWLDPVVPVALAALGVRAGLGIGHARPGDGRLLAAASLAAALTALAVAAGMAALARAGVVDALQPAWLVPLATGLAAATALTAPAGEPFEPRTPGVRVTELALLGPALAGALLMAWLRTGSAGAAALLLVQSTLVTIALTAAGWLLLSRATTDTDRRVFGIAVLLLAGGAAAALSQSAIFGGLVAGLCWRWAGGPPRESLSRDVHLVQHPLLVLVLLAAGARTVLSPATLVLGAAYLALRTVGVLAGARLLRPLAGAKPPGELRAALLQPGVFGVAFALNLAGVAGDPAGPGPLLLGAVVLGSAAGAIVAPSGRPIRRPA
ncbi:MAG: hypothetical protein AB7I25_05910 [Vicinamibacterales bacterium]